MEQWEDRLEDEVGLSGWRQGRKWTVRVAALLTVVMLAGVAAAIALFTHTFPTFTPGQVASSTCTTLSIQDTGGAWVRFNCGGGVAALVTSAGTATATLSGFAGYDDLYIVQGTPGGSCTTGTTASQRLDPGPTSVAFGGSGKPVGNWNYCADFSTLAPKVTFTVAWSQ